MEDHVTENQQKHILLTFQSLEKLKQELHDNKQDLHNTKQELLVVTAGLTNIGDTLTFL